MSVLSNNLKRFRIASNLTQEQAAERLNVSAQTVSRWECNTTLPDVVILPKIAELYGVAIDALFKENSNAYDNNAQRLGSVFEASLKPEDFLRADMEYRDLIKSGDCTAKDLRLYGILYQHMMYLCIKKAEELYDRVIADGPGRDPETYWAVRRQKEFFLWEIGRNQESIDEYLPLVEKGSGELQEWLCLIHAYVFAGEIETALRWVGKANDIFSENAALHVCAGDLLRLNKQYDEAFRHWRRAAEMEPDWLDAAYSMAECYEELGNYGEAYLAYLGIAENLEGRGFDVEANLPRLLANQCRSKMST